MKNLILNALAAIGIAASLTPTVHAEMSATALPGDTRLVEFEYDPDNTFLVLARPKSVTHVAFGEDEKISTVAGGDTKNWELSPTSDRRHLFVKPLFEGLETSMTVLTDKRSYQFVLRSTGPGSKWYQRVTWRYGQTILMDMRAQEEQRIADDKAAREAAKVKENITLATNIDPQKLRFTYELSGDAPFKPTSVFDDGKFTWIRMPADLVELPALFAASEDQELAIVNYIIKGEYMLAQRLMDTGVLRLGKQEVRFTRKKPSRGFFGGLE